MAKINDKYFAEGSKDEPIEALLTEGEEIVWRGKPRKGSYILSRMFKGFIVALIWVLFDGFLIYINITQGINIPIYGVVMLCVFFALHLIPVWLWIANFITVFRRYRLEEYAFTTERIIIKEGFLAGNIINIEYDSISSVNLKVGIIEKLYGVGDIYIVAGDQKAVLEDLSNPYNLVSKLQKIARSRKKDVFFPEKLRERIDGEGSEQK